MQHAEYVFSSKSQLIPDNNSFCNNIKWLINAEISNILDLCKLAFLDFFSMCCAELSSCCDTDILDQLRMELIFTHFSYLEQPALVGPKERSNKPSVFSTHQSKLTNLHVITKAGLPRE